ncbi:hypothetical protein ACFLVH_02695 [Chloroflexota bacterium]
MRTSSRWLTFILVVVLLTGLLAGCATQQPPPGITYEVGEGAEITNVAWYVDSGELYVDVTVRNTTTATRKFDVGVKVDDYPFFFDNRGAAKEVEAGATLTYGTRSAVSTAYPKKLVIRITPQ